MISTVGKENCYRYKCHRGKGKLLQLGVALKERKFLVVMSCTIGKVNSCKFELHSKKGKYVVVCMICTVGKENCCQLHNRTGKFCIIVRSGTV